MPRYIDADELLKCKGQAYDENGVGLYAVGTGDILRMPTADVVEVVRCKDCKYFRSGGADTVDDWMECSELFISLDSDDGYCAWAKKRGGDAT